MKLSSEEPQDSSEILGAFFAGSKCNVNFCNGILIFNVSSRVLPPQSLPRPIWYVAAVSVEYQLHSGNLHRQSLELTFCVFFSASFLQLLTLF